ncbi:hypothetical protein [Pseudomarimonas arenosa]|uniref:MSHA biogenesis protein MshK n=1 Tax=Pseudomarimonas arenosa TaxID=2774145 RepID=A0AAW3ZI46_9GAMM|nr:hypothetical protein [Pseudomarimonas arenosa]MBD8525753.1 hypothetical protein [Pseudomarimonas arenosa]
MISIRWVLLLSGLLNAAAALAATPSAADDQAWINSYMQRQRAVPAGKRALPANALRLEQGEQWQGRSVRVQLLDGRVRRGMIEQVDARAIRLRVIVNGGRFVYSIDRSQIYFVVPE